MEWEDLIKKFKQIYNDDKNLIFLSVPGRVNLLGMHVDHRGGSVNPIATREMKIIVQKRIDDTVQVFNSDERFAEQKFLISEEIPDKVEWNQWINNIKIEKGNWVNYIKAGVLYFKNKFFENKISGMNLLIDSDIPMAGGLSSSTALNMGASFAFLKVNDISLPDEEFIDSCGEAEWYVGTRGGKGDQAAIVLSKRGNISHISFSPLKIEHLPFPEDYCVAICNTFKEAKKSEGAKAPRSHQHPRGVSNEFAEFQKTEHRGPHVAVHSGTGRVHHDIRGRRCADVAGGQTLGSAGAGPDPDDRLHEPEPRLHDL